MQTKFTYENKIKTTLGTCKQLIFDPFVPINLTKEREHLIFKIAHCDKKQAVLFILRAQDGGVDFMKTNNIIMPLNKSSIQVKYSFTLTINLVIAMRYILKVAYTNISMSLSVLRKETNSFKFLSEKYLKNLIYLKTYYNLDYYILFANSHSGMLDKQFIQIESYYTCFFVVFTENSE